MPSDADRSAASTAAATTSAAPAAASGAGPAAVLTVDGLEVSYRSNGDWEPALHGVSLTVAPGERVAVVGESGSGKSTTAAAVLGLLPGTGTITAGMISFHGEDITDPTPARLRRLRGRQIGLVPQDPMSNLNPALRVGRQIAETLAAHGLATGRSADRRAIELMGEAGIPDADQRYRQYPHEFSGGLRQRVLIAIALACEPELLIADEPTSALDVTVQRQILDHLERLRAARGTSMLLITHDLGLAAERADRVIVMERGRVVESGPAVELLTDPQHEYTQRLIAAIPSLKVRARTLRQGQGMEGQGPDLVEGPVDALRQAQGSSVAAKGPSVPAQGPSDAVLTADGLRKEYRIRGRRGQRLVAVDDVSFSLTKGSTIAIVGESGSGKSTTAKLVMGLEDPTAGEVRVDGRVVQLATGQTRRSIRREMQPVFQDPYASLNPTFSIQHIIDEPLRLFRIGDRTSRRRRVAELLDQVALPAAIAGRRPSELSGGQRQRVAIARALALEPSILVCDEAVSALDVVVQDQTLRLLDDLQQRLGLSYLFITHDLAVVRQIADRVLVMNRGKAVEQGTVDQVFDAPQSEYTRRLLDAIPGAGLLA